MTLRVFHVSVYVCLLAVGVSSIIRLIARLFLFEKITNSESKSDLEISAMDISDNPNQNDDGSADNSPSKTSNGAGDDNENSSSTFVPSKKSKIDHGNRRKNGDRCGKGKKNVPRPEHEPYYSIPGEVRQSLKDFYGLSDDFQLDNLFSRFVLSRLTSFIRCLLSVTDYSNVIIDSLPCSFMLRSLDLETESVSLQKIFLKFRTCANSQKRSKHR